MALETASFITDLVETNPVSTDGLLQTDDHLRLIKGVLKNTFPNIDAPVTATPDDLNFGGGVPLGGIIMWTPALGAFPTNWHLADGATITIAGSPVVLPDCRDRFVFGAGGAVTAGTTAAAVGTTDSQGAHNHAAITGDVALTQAQIPAHTHGVNDPGHSHFLNILQFATNNTASAGSGTGSIFGGQATGSSGTGIFLSNTGGGAVHSHSIGTDGAHTHAVTASPPYIALAYIVRIS